MSEEKEFWEKKLMEFERTILYKISELEELKRYLDKGGLLEQVLNNIEEMKKTWDQNIEGVLQQTLEALDKRDERIEELEKSLKRLWDHKHPIMIHEIAELKELLNEVAQAQIGEIEQIKEVLRKLFKQFEKSHDEVINRSFFTKLLAKLDVGSARQTVKPKMTDDEIMRFNEEIMAKVHKREVQPLDDSKPPEPREDDFILDKPTKRDKRIISEFVKKLEEISRELTIDDYINSEQTRLNTIRKVNKEIKKWEKRL